MRTPTIRQRNGFTLIELLAACAIIAVLIALLLPVMQSNRESTNQSRAQADLSKLCRAAQTALLRTGTLPTAMAPLWDDTDIVHVLDSADGYNFRLTNGQIIAEPLGGRTASLTYTLVIGPQCRITSTPTPKSDSERSKMFTDLLVSAAFAVQRLVDLSGYYAPLQSAATSADAAYMLKASDGGFSFSSIQRGLTGINWGDGITVMGQFGNDIIRIMQLGANGEQWATFPTSLVAGNYIGVDLFSISGLRSVTRSFVDGVYLDMLTKDLDGTLPAIDSFVAHVDQAKAAGQLTLQEASTLTSIARMMPK